MLVWSTKYDVDVIYDTEKGTVKKIFDDPRSWVYWVSPSGQNVLIRDSSNIWSAVSLQNLYSEIQFTITKESIAITGTAQDLNFEGYKLEYADTKTPTSWNLIVPPADVPVVNSEIAIWIPPYEGTFFVRLTAWDKAGNKASSKKRVSWGGEKQVLAGIYKDIDVISPKNADGINDEVRLNFTVVLPARSRVYRVQ